MNTQEKIVLLAEFMGWYKSPYIHLPNKIYKLDDVGTEVGTNKSNLQYSTSYDWLMPVFKKFKSIKFEGDTENHAYWEAGQWNSKVGSIILNGTITEAFEALVEAVKWLNSMTQTIKTDN